MSDEPKSEVHIPVDDADAIITQIGHLSPGTLVRRLAVTLLRGKRPEDLQPLVGVLINPAAPNWREREVAAWTIGHAPLNEAESDSATELLLGVLENSNGEGVMPRFLRAIGRAGIISLAGGFGASFLLTVFYELFSRFEYGHPQFFEMFAILTSMAFFCGMPFTLTASLWYDATRRDRVRAAAAEALGNLGAIESVGALAGAMFDRNKRVAASAAAALHKTLPLLTSNNYGEFGAESISNLGRLLKHPDSQLVGKVLDALDKVGTSHAIPYIENYMRTGRTIRLRDMAHEVLQRLEMRARQESQRDRLVRPTTAPDDPSLFLLRPARDSGPEDSSVLLRPSGTDDNRQ